MKFFTSWIFILTALLQIAGPLLFGFGEWANVIQYVSAFGMMYAFWHYTHIHRREIQRLEQHILHVRKKVDKRGR